MKKVKVHIDIELKFYNEYFIGGGKGISSLDSYVLKDINDKPYIPATTLKGKLRYISTLIYDGLTNSRCEGYYEKHDKCNCIICNMFGSKENSIGRLKFQNLLLNDNGDNKGRYSVRNGIEVNRKLKVTKDKSLFKYETVALDRDEKFIGEIDGYLSEDIYKKQIIVLFLAFNMMDTIGAMQSRGLGWLDSSSSIEVKVDGVTITKEILQEWRKEIEI